MNSLQIHFVLKNILSKACILCVYDSNVELGCGPPLLYLEHLPTSDHLILNDGDDIYLDSDIQWQPRDLYGSARRLLREVRIIDCVELCELGKVGNKDLGYVRNVP